MNSKNAYQPGERRPIASRDTTWATVIAHWLARQNVTPNAISTSSMVFAALAAAAIVATAYTSGLATRGLWLIALIGIQLRLLANLFDGMVAVEGGHASPVGELFNEIPDRVSDSFILVALGWAAASLPVWGLAAALCAVFVAYIRAIGASVGAGQAFAGIMAKQRRMFVVSVLCVFHVLVPQAWSTTAWIGPLGATGLVLVLICAGCGITAITRLGTIASRLRQQT